MDCFGLQALTDSSEESCLDDTSPNLAENDENNQNMSIDFSLVNAPKSPSKEEKVTCRPTNQLVRQFI
jgi:hypothetical protein